MHMFKPYLYYYIFIGSERGGGDTHGKNELNTLIMELWFIVVKNVSWCVTDHLKDQMMYYRSQT